MSLAPSRFQELLRLQSIQGIIFLISLWTLFHASTPLALSQDPSTVNSTELQNLADEARTNQSRITAPVKQPSPGIDFLELMVRGGWFMVPIAIVSLIVVTIAFERAYGVRRARILPPMLVRGLGQIARETETLEPRSAYKLCQQYPSVAATVIRNMLLKVGRPHSEIEKAVSDASQREADRVLSNVRWLNLAAGVAPLLGLLGTVWGLIRAFHDTTNLGPSQNRGEFLAQGIYEALVTTLAGLLVAIPAAILAHYFEGKVSSLFRQLEELLQHLMPQIESYEGRVRFEAIGRELAMRSAENSSLSNHEVGSLPARPTAKVPAPYTSSRKTP